MHDIIIIGGGPAGLTAAVYALRAGRSALIIEKNGFGGQIAFSPKVENIPGIQQISGAAFAERMVEQALNLGADMELETVESVEPAGGIFRVYTAEGGEYPGRSVILATGVRHRLLGLPGEEGLIGSGLSFCAVCDSAFYAGQETAMIGGGNSALQEALLLSEICKKVTIVQNLPFLTGEKRLAEALSARANVEILYSTQVSAYIQEAGRLTGLQLRSESGEERFLPVSGAFLAVGLVPENEAFAPLAPLDDRGYFAAAEDCAGSVPGVFIAGDCRAKQIRQVVTAASDGAIAAMAACRYLERRDRE